MRRSRFVSAIEQGAQESGRTSIREALSFDVSSPDSPDEDSLAAWRVAGFQHAPLLLGFTHLLVAFTCILLHPDEALTASRANPLVPVVLILLLDLVAAVAIRWRDRLQVAPATMVRALCLYVGATGILWILFGSAVLGQTHSGHDSTVLLGLAAGVTVTAIISVRSPPLAVVNMLVATLGALLFSQTPMIRAESSCSARCFWPTASPTRGR